MKRVFLAIVIASGGVACTADHDPDRRSEQRRHFPACSDRRARHGRRVRAGAQHAGRSARGARATDAARPGAAAPPDSAPNDLWHWEVQVEVADLDAALDTVIRAGGRARPDTDVRALDLGYDRAALARDRDGHYLRLVER